MARCHLIAAVLLSVCALSAAEHQGVVRYGNLAVPGATVTATLGDQKFVTTTDAQGAYGFADLAEGVWGLQVEMQCFARLRRDIGVAPGAPSPEWQLKLLPETDLLRDSDVAELRDETSETSATPDLLIDGSVNNGAASPFAQSMAFGNNRRGAKGLYTGAVGAVLDNSALDARPFSLTGQNTPKAAYNHLQGTVSLGGPLPIPHLRRFRPPTFFAGYQMVRNRNAATQSALMPPAAERSGDFSQTVPLFDPLTGTPFPDNVIPQSRISPQSKSLLRFYPLPNFEAGARYNYQVPVRGTFDQDTVQTRVSQSFGYRNQVNGGFTWQRTGGDSTSLFGFTDRSQTSAVDADATWQHRFGSRMFGKLTYTFNRLSSRLIPYFANRENVSGEAGIAGNNQEAVNWGPPDLVFASGIAGLSDAQGAFNRAQTSSVAPSLVWNRRSHTVTMGADYRRQQSNVLSQQNARGLFTFTGAAGADFAGFLLGVPNASSIAFGNADKYFRSSIYDAYYTDDWRVRPGLTVNAGMRWEYWSPVTERYGRLVNLDVASGFSAVAPVIDSRLRPDKRGLEPRIGIAWRPLLASSLVIRAGYGINRDTSVYQSIASQMAQQSPLSTSLSVQNSAANPLTLAKGFLASPSTTLNTFAVNPDFRVGYAQNWNFSIQRDLPLAAIVNVTYLGIKGTRAQQQFLPNTYPDGAVNPCPSCPTGFAYLDSTGNSTRHSAQIQFRRRMRRGFAASAMYTFSKSIDDAALGGRQQSAAVIAQNWLDLRAERSLSNFDQRHVLSAQAQYSARDWTFFTQLDAGSGLPLTPIYLAAVRGTGVTGSIRPDYTGASSSAASPGFFVNKAAYAPPAPGHWGNAGRDTIAGPAQLSLRASAGRTFRLTDRFNGDLRLDATNPLNHVTYTSWVTNYSSAQFGLPASAHAMRSVQATFRVRF